MMLVASLIGGVYISESALFAGNGQCGVTRQAAFTLPRASGRIDHMSYDAGSDRLFVAAFGSNSLDVINFTSGLLEQSLQGFSEPQGVLFVPNTRTVFVSNGGNGNLSVLDGRPLRSAVNLTLGSDADNLRFDTASGLVYAAYGSGALSSIDPHTYQVEKTVNFSGHPEGFEVADRTGLMYVNVPTSGYVAAVSLANFSIVSRWPLGNATGNFPMALDQTHGRLMIGTRSPSQLIVLDTTSGKQVTAINIPGDPDDIFFDSTSSCIYIASGAGYLTTVREVSPSQFVIAGHIATGAGARTALLTDGSKLFVAVPSSGVNPAVILEFRTS